MLALDHHLLTYTLLALKSTEWLFNDKFWYLPILYCCCWELLIFTDIFIVSCYWKIADCSIRGYVKAVRGNILFIKFREFYVKAVTLQ